MKSKKQKRIQWHPGFCSAVRLELWENHEDLDYINEYNLNRKPIQIDLLVIKKEKHASIRNVIGKIFRGHNIIEYKSPRDGLNIDTYFKVLAYACLYKAAGEHVNSVTEDDITVTFVRDRKPVKLLQELKRKNRTVECVSNGIYYIGEPWFAVQLIVTSELDEEEHCWLRALTQRLSEAEVQRLICRIQNLEQKAEWKYADSVLEVAVTANKKVFEIVKEEMGMCNALRELMAPEIEQELAAATERGRTRGLSQGIAQGISQGIAQGVEQEIYSCLSEGLYGTAIGARKLNITENELIQRMTKAGYTLPQ